MSQDHQRFLILDITGEVTELRGDLLNIATLLGRAFEMYEALPGLCFAVSHTSSARLADPNLHVSKFARTSSGVIEPFFGYAIFFGGIRQQGETAILQPLDPGNEQVLLRSVERSRAWLKHHPAAAAGGSALAEQIRRTRQMANGTPRG